MAKEKKESLSISGSFFAFIYMLRYIYDHFFAKIVHNITCHVGKTRILAKKVDLKALLFVKNTYLCALNI